MIGPFQPPPRRSLPTRRASPPGRVSSPCGPCGPANLGGPTSSPWAPRGSSRTGVEDTSGAGGGGTPPVVPRRGPAPVDFLTAAFFKILAETTITNVPTSSVIGNVGLSPNTAAAFVGFAQVLDGSGEFATSAQVVGRMYAADYAPPTPALLTQAVLDMMTAYTDAAGRPNDFFNLNAGLLGGLSLQPATYKFTSGVTIASDLVLNGGPDDTYIFQIDGTLDVGPGVNIILVGGLKPQNIVWVVAGAVTINPGATFNGNILAQTSIAVQTGSSVFGKLLAQAAVTLDNNFVNTGS